MKRDKSIVQKKFSWVNYSVYAALRGPDVRGDELPQEASALNDLKQCITKRIRSIVFSPHSTITYAKELDIDRIRTILIEINAYRWHHYLVHLYDAVQCTVDHAIWRGQGALVAGLLHSAISRGILARKL